MQLIMRGTQLRDGKGFRFQVANIDIDKSVSVQQNAQKLMYLQSYNKLNKIDSKRPWRSGVV